MHGFGVKSREKRVSGVSVPASADDCEVPIGVMAKILVSRMTSFAFVARVGAVAPPVPFGSGQGPQPLLGDDTRRKICAAVNKDNDLARGREMFTLFQNLHM